MQNNQTDEKYISRILFDNIVVGHLEMYLDILANPLPPGSNEYWTALHNLYSTVGENEKRLLRLMMTHISTDAVSQLLAILDGVAAVDGLNKEFSLMYGGTKLSDNLQEYFLMKAESWEQLI